MKLSKQVKVLSLVFLVSLGSDAFAADKPTTAKASAKNYSRRYGMAGCGVGSMILTKNDVPNQIGVWALNLGLAYVSSFFHPTWAMSSGSYNCTDSPAETAMEQEVFLQANFATLTKEAASGARLHLDGLAEVFGCEDKPGFAQLSQSRFNHLFGTRDPRETLERYRGSIHATDRALHCSRLTATS